MIDLILHMPVFFQIVIGLLIGITLGLAALNA